MLQSWEKHVADKFAKPSKIGVLEKTFSLFSNFFSTSAKLSILGDWLDTRLSRLTFQTFSVNFQISSGPKS